MYLSSWSPTSLSFNCTSNLRCQVTAAAKITARAREKARICLLDDKENASCEAATGFRPFRGTKRKGTPEGTSAHLDELGGEIAVVPGAELQALTLLRLLTERDWLP